MSPPRIEHRTGLDGLRAASDLLHRVRSVHPTAGLLEAADLQWWWRAPRSTDHFPQLFWFDDHGRPSAAVIATDWGDVVALDPIVQPDAPSEWVGQVLERGLSHAIMAGLHSLEVVIDRTDDAMRLPLTDLGFTLPVDDRRLAVFDSWMAAADRPPISTLHEDYRLATRLDTMTSPHHMILRSGHEVEARLRQTSLYRPDLDLVVLDRDDRVAAYGLFWFDPDTSTGLVEPMRTEDAHQGRGLARHLLTTGLDRLAAAGAQRLKVCFRADNPVARGLYTSVGFAPDKQSIAMARPAGAQ